MKQTIQILSLVVAVLVSAMLTSCSGDGDDEVSLVKTGNVSDITDEGATITCSFSSDLLGSSMTLGIIYHTDKDDVETYDGWTKTTSDVSGSQYTIKLDELDYDQTYYYRAFLKTGGIYYYGDVRSFTTDYYHIKSISLSEQSITIKKGYREKIYVSFNPSFPTNTDVTWSSEDESVAYISYSDDGYTYDEDGNRNGYCEWCYVRGYAVGSTNITVTTEDGGYTATCHVTVVE